MEDIEPYCDSEEEVFFGPVTEKERLIYEALEFRKEKFNANSEEISTRYMDGDEGLHALAEAASMLSISSWEVEKVKEVKGSMGEEEVSFSKTLPSLNVKEDAGIMNGSEGSTMELDAVKFLTEHVPEHNCKYEVVNHHVDSVKETYQIPDEILHHTSLASSVDNISHSLNHTVGSGSPVDSFIVLEAQCKIEDSLEKKFEKLAPNFEMEQLPPLNLSSTELQNINDESVFEIKLSDNEEEIEKVERNLKVEEIIKFLADEDTKTDSEEKKETCVENIDQDKSHQIDSQNEKVNSDDDDVIIIEMNDNQIVDIPDCQSHGMEKFPRNKEICFKHEAVDSDAALLKIKKEVVPKEENVIIPTIDLKKEIQSVDGCELEGERIKVEDKSKDELDKLISMSSMEKVSKPIDGEIVKVPSISLEKGDAQEVGNLQVREQHLKASSNSKDAYVTHRNMKTPSKAQLRPVPKAATPNFHKQPLFGDSKRHPGTSSYLMSPARNVFSSSRIPLKSTSGKNIKNSKINTMIPSKIPHAHFPVTPSPRKTKYADVMSPVAQYIHGKPTLLVMNKHASTVKSNLKKPIWNKSGVSEKATEDRGAENVDLNNISSAPLPSNIHYKSAVPVKIFSPSPSKCNGNGPVGSVSKHIGRIKITSLKAGNVEMPLGMQCRESLIPDGEVSVLLTKEMSAAGDISTL